MFFKNGSSYGCFNTKMQPMTLFNRICEMTYAEFHASNAAQILNKMPQGISFFETEDEKMTSLLPEELKQKRQKWFDTLDIDQRLSIVSLPNFDKNLFFEITGILVVA